MTSITSSPSPALAGLALALLLSALGTSSANVALPTLQLAFGATFQQVQWVVLAYLLALTALVVGAGRLGDLLGRRRLLLAGIALFGAASLAGALAPNLALLVAARAAQGAGAALMMALAMALVGEAVPKERSGRAMGLLGTMSAVGTALGPSLGGLLIAWAGWRAIFLVNLPLALLAFGLVWRALPADRRRPAFRLAGLDPLGSALLASTLIAYALALTWGRGAFGPLNLALLLAALAGLGLFALVEARVAAPLLRLTLLREPVFGAGVATRALVATVVMATLVVGPFYLSAAFGLDAAQVGLALSAGPAAAALAGVPAGRLVDRHGPRRMALAGLAAMAAGCLLLVALPAGFGLAGYLGPLLLLTSAYALFQTANNTAVMADVAPDRRGAVSGLLSLSRNLGLITGAAAMGALYAAVATRAGGAAATAAGAGMRATLAVAALLLVVAIGLAVAAGASRKGRAA